MASTHCPVCPSTAVPQFLVYTSQGAEVNYYICPTCRHIWTTSKDGATFRGHVTPAPAKAELPPSAVRMKPERRQG